MITDNSAKFLFDCILSADDICNLGREKKLIQRAIDDQKKIILYGQRNFGKTSLVKSIIIPQFQKNNKNNFVIFIDLMEVKTLESINERFIKSFQNAFMKSYPVKNFFQESLKILASLKPEVSIDGYSGEPSLSLTQKPNSKQQTFQEILEIIALKITKEKSVLIVIDEFQDLALIDEAQGLMRDSLQKIKSIPIVLMGSKKHLLSAMFAKQNSPLYGMGIDIEFKEIPYTEYYEYMLVRFKPQKIKISLEDATFLQNCVNRVPEAMNTLCDYILNHYSQRVITEPLIKEALSELISSKRSRYEEYLSHFSENEEKFMIHLARSEPVRQLQSKDFLKKITVTSSGIQKMTKKMMDHAVISKKEAGYSLEDPLLKWFLRFYR